MSKDIVNMVSIMQAFSAGKILEQRSKNSTGKWIRVISPSWNWDKNDYRVADTNKYKIIEQIEDGCEFHSMRIRKKVYDDGRVAIQIPKYMTKCLSDLMCDGGNATYAIIGLNEIAKQSIDLLKEYQKKADETFKRITTEEKL